ncbi:hypothetical protein YC2023_119245 [Brassica napus]
MAHWDIINLIVALAFAQQLFLFHFHSSDNTGVDCHYHYNSWFLYLWSNTLGDCHTNTLACMLWTQCLDHSFGKVDMNSDPRGLRTDGSRGDTKGCGIAQRYYQTSIVAGCDAPVQQKKDRNLEITSPRN